METIFLVIIVYMFIAYIATLFVLFDYLQTKQILKIHHVLASGFIGLLWPALIIYLLLWIEITETSGLTRSKHARKSKKMRRM